MVAGTVYIAAAHAGIAVLRSGDSGASFDVASRISPSNLGSQPRNPFILADNSLLIPFVDFRAGAGQRLTSSRIYVIRSQNGEYAFDTPHFVADVPRAFPGGGVLKDSLRKRTLAHEQEPTRELIRGLLHSRADWLWRTRTKEQRQAFLLSGLGRKPGLFLQEQLDTLVDVLCQFQNAVALDDGDAAASAALAFAEKVMAEPFFAVRKLPTEWEIVLSGWIKGTAFSEILDDRAARDAHRTQVFVQEGVVFRLVWAAEAVRVQAVAPGHPRVGELGDGPAFSSD